MVDFVEYDIDPDVWIKKLLQEVRSGKYQPQPPHRFSLGKSKGFSRWMTLPEIPDLVLYHAIATRVVERAHRRRRKHRHVYFLRDRIAKAQGQALAEAIDVMRAPPTYATGFLVWLRFHQYRRFMILNRVFPFLAVTDIANFFDSIVYGQVESCLFELGFQRNFVGLLLLLLERLSVREAYSSFPRVGLPVDEFDCSRCLAHVVLFPHDDRMVAAVGESGYARWMDDQTIGVRSEAEAYKLLAEVNASLRRMNLAPNSEKTTILSIRQARRHFHFDINDALDRIENRIRTAPRRGRKETVRWRGELRAAWALARQHEGKGEWGKILKRTYLLAGGLQLKMLVRRAHDDALKDPGLADRVSAYLRAVCSPREFIRRAEGIFTDERNVYDDVRRAFAEDLLRLRPESMNEVRTLRELARESLRQPRASRIPADVGALMLFRYGDLRSARTLVVDLRERPTSSHIRAVALVLAGFGSSCAAVVVRQARRGLHRPLDRVARFLEQLEAGDMPPRIKARLQLRYDAVDRQSYLDTRTLLTAALVALGTNARPGVREIGLAWLPKLPSFEVALVRRRLLKSTGVR